MFEKFVFTLNQIDKYYQSAKRDFNIAKSSNVNEVSFRFAYDSLLKLAIAVCAYHGLRVKANRGHHAELINKLSDLLSDSDIAVIANEMRSKRNWDLYGGGAIISEKEISEYVKWIEDVFKQVDKFISSSKLL